MLPSSNDLYREHDYWEQRYRERDHQIQLYDWFQRYEAIRPLVHEAITDRNARIVVLGCGNSELSEQLYADGSENIVNVDFSQTVISFMRDRCKAMTKMTCRLPIGCIA